MNQFQTWMTIKYIEWRGNAMGRNGTISAYARWVGVPQPTMSEWLNGNNVPESPKNIKALVDKYGKEVYEVLYH